MKWLRCCRLEANNFLFLAGVNGPSESFDKELAFEDQIAFLFLGIFRQSNNYQVIWAIRHGYSSDVVECQSMLDFTIFGV